MIQKPHIDTLVSPSAYEVRITRFEVGLSQVAAAALINRTRVSWGKWETGVSVMPVELWTLFLIRVGLVDPSPIR